MVNTENPAVYKKMFFFFQVIPGFYALMSRKTHLAYCTCL